MIYRPEIDGLRAVVVLPVILFHAGFKLFSGGFVGVDVFFVVSGYLITTIIISELDAGRFSLPRFYERRARRILPALFFVMACCVPFAWLWMSPPQFKDFSQSLVAVALFGSNFLFWREDGYFAAAAEQKPLLHTWSLAVEEQYYMLFPLALILLWRFRRDRVVLFVALAAMVSLIASEWGWRNAPAANFYLAPTRIWELLAGSLCAFVLRNGAPFDRALWGNLAAAAGLALICYSVVAFGDGTPAPSVYLLLPVMGTCLIILFAGPGTWVARLLRARPLMAIGLISYSAYLWHQPLFAFARLRFGSELQAGEMAALSLASLAIAYFSWRFVERPVRRPSDGSRRVLALRFAAVASLFLVVGVVGAKTQIFKEFYLEQRLTSEEAKVYDLFQQASGGGLNMFDDGKCRFWSDDVDGRFERRFRACREKHGKAWLVLGDSHAMNLFNILSKADAKEFLVSLSRGGCRPGDEEAECDFDELKEFIDRHLDGIAVVVYHQSGAHFLLDEEGNSDSDKAFQETSKFVVDMEEIGDTWAYLEELGGKVKTVWIGPFVEARRDFSHPDTIAMAARQGLTINPKSLEHFRGLEALLKRYNGSRDGRFSYRSLNDVLNLPADFVISGTCVTYRDEDHFSPCGEYLIAEKLKPAIARGFLD